jgi:predicted molibdopterin-dependent oxidoreductase YjgC
MSFKAGVCNLCGTGCGHFLRVEDNKIKAVSPNQHHPVNQGRLCVRGWHINELLNSDERITAPMVRQNGQLQAVDYHQALQMITQKVAALKNPATEIAVLASPRSSNEDNYLLMKLAKEVLGTNQISIGGEAGYKSSLRAMQAAYGVAGATGKLSELDNAQYILLVGNDLTKQNPMIGSKLHYAARRGARVVTISSSKTQMAKLSTRHYQQKPGTKSVLLNAFAKALLEIRQKDASSQAKDKPGFNAYAEKIKQLMPEKISTITGVSYAQIQEEMKLLASSPSLMILFSAGISGLDDETINSIINFSQLTGKMDNPYSGVIPVAGICNLQGSFDMGLVTDSTVNIWPLLEKKSPLKIILVVDHDDGIIRYAESFSSAELVVYLGAFNNRFMNLAQLVLPIAAFTEYDGTYTATDRRIQFNPAKTSTPKDVLPAWQLYCKLAQMAGKNWQYPSSEAVFKEISMFAAGYKGMTYASLSQNFGGYWDTHSVTQKKGKFLAIKGEYPPPATSTQYPFALMAGKAQHFWHQNNLMRKTMIPRREYDATLLLYPQGYIEICSEDAKRLQVRDKWPVNVTSTAGTMKIAVKISEDVQPGSAYIPYFIKNMIGQFLIKHDEAFSQGEETIIPVRIEKI